MKKLTVEEVKRLIARYDHQTLAGEILDLLGQLDPQPTTLRWTTMPETDQNGPEHYLEDITLSYADGKQRILQYEDSDENGQSLLDDRLYNGNFYNALTSYDTDDLDALAPEQNVTVTELREIAEMTMPRLFVSA